MNINMGTKRMKAKLYALKGCKYLLVSATTLGLGLLSAQASVFPDVQVGSPPSNPDFPESFGAFDPPVSNMTVQANAPEIYEYTKDNDAGDTMLMSGGGFSLYTNHVSTNIVTVSSAVLNDSFAATFNLLSTWTPETAIEIKCSTYKIPSNGARLFHAEEGKKIASIYYMNGKWVAGDGVGGTIELGDYDEGAHTFLYDSHLGVVRVDGVSYALSGGITDSSKLYVACNSTGYQDYPMLLESLKVWQAGVLVESIVPVVNGTFEDLVSGTIYQSKAMDPVRSLPLPFTVNADREVVVSGEEGQDSIFIAYGGAVTDSCPILRLDKGDVAISLPQSLPSDEVYMVWPGNQSGMGHPVVVNQAEAWWVGPDKVSPGGEFSLYGRNFGTNCHVYIEELDQWVESDSCNPYKADFVMPSHAKVGTYSIWAHNTKGGRYGWAKPLICSVEDDFSWSGNMIDVKTFGATGDGVTDDWPSIARAISSSSIGDTIYFPQGTYLISYRFSSMTGRRIMGAGMDSTMIKPHPEHTQGGMLFDGLYKNVEVSNVSFETVVNGASLFRFRGEDVLFSSVGMSSFVADGGVADTPFNFQNTGPRHTFRNCRIVNSGNPGNFSISGSRQVFVENCKFYGARECSIIIGSWGGQQISIEGCSLSPYDNTEAGYFDGRWFVTADYWGAVNKIYFGENISSNCAPPKIAGYHANTGEQILIEGGKYRIRGEVVSATENSVQLPGITDFGNKHVVTIVKGKGYGQTRKIDWINVDSGTIFLEEPWRVLPDESSIVVVSATTYRFVVYNNHFDGKEEWTQGTVHSASTGVASFGGSIELIVDNNKMTDLRTGIYHWPLGGLEVEGVRSLQSCFFNTFQNNSISNGYTAVLNIVSESDESLLLDGGIYAATYRGNTIDSMSSKGFTFSTSLPENLIRMSVFERNTINNCPVAINETPYLQNQLYIDNSGTNANSGVAMAIAYNHVPALKNNAWVGYVDEYQKGPSTELPPECLLELPKRVVFVVKSSGQSLPVWNLGVSPLDWIASTETPWIALVKDSGVVTNQADNDVLTFTINEDLFPEVEGVVTGKVVVATVDGMQEKMATILCSISGNASNGREISYLLDGFEGATVYLYDEFDSLIANYGEIVDSSLVIDGLTAGEWYRVSIKEQDDLSGNWNEITNWWVGGGRSDLQ